jgi:4-aminobutyrate aminotransferase-like enzyme
MTDIHIKTEIPHPKTQEILAGLYKYEPYDMQSHLPVIWDKAEGHTVQDMFGNVYIDFTSSIFVLSFADATSNTLDKAVIM